MLHQVITFSDQLHISIFNPVMDHFYIVTGAIRTDISHTWCTVFRSFSRDFFQDIRYQLISFFLTTRHNRWPFQCALFSTGNTCTDKVDTRVSQLFIAANSILVESIPTVNQDITLIQVREQGLNSRICTRTSLNHQHNPTWLFNRVYKRLYIIAWHKIFLRMRGNDVLCLVC